MVDTELAILIKDEKAMQKENVQTAIDSRTGWIAIAYR